MVKFVVLHSYPEDIMFGSRVRGDICPKKFFSLPNNIWDRSLRLIITSSSLPFSKVIYSFLRHDTIYGLTSGLYEY
jgi:hypothetical protein